MSFPSNESPFVEHPASPVPSYQCSSQSSSSIGSPSSTSTASAWLGASLLSIQPPGTPGSTTTDNTVDSMKSNVDSARERLSGSRALLLLEKFAAGEGNSSSNINDMKSVIDYNREKGANLKALALLNETSEAIERQSPPTALVRERSTSALKSSSSDIESPEQMAESTRKPRERTAEDVRDPETVAGMKCEHDIEREEWAKKRALWLMTFGIKFV